MAANRARGSRRAVRGLLGVAVAMAHLAAFFVLSLSQPPERPEAKDEAREITAFIPAPTERPPPRLPRPRDQKKKPTPAEARQAVQPRQSITNARQNGPAPAWTLPSGGGPTTGLSGLENPFSERDALRSSVGCDQEGLKLRPDEQERCAARSARWARRGHTIGPAADDPKRAAELAAEEEDNRQRQKWKSGYGDHGNANAALPPRSVNHPTSALDDPLPH